LLEGQVKEDAAAKKQVVVKKEVEEVVRILPYPKTSRLTAFRQYAGYGDGGREVNGGVKGTDGTQGRVGGVETHLSSPSGTHRLGDYDLDLVVPKGEKFNIKEHPWIKMEWTPLPLERFVYQLEISKDPAFSRVLSHATHMNSLSIQFDDPGSITGG